jgi:hypothetical protein
LVSFCFKSSSLSTFLLSIGCTIGGATGTLQPILTQAALHGLEHDAANRQRTIFVVGPFDNDPRRVGRIGDSEHMTGHMLKAVIGLQAGIAFLGYPPGGTGILFQRLDPLLLAILRQVEPEFQDQRPSLTSIASKRLMSSRYSSRWERRISPLMRSVIGCEYQDPAKFRPCLWAAVLASSAT